MSSTLVAEEKFRYITVYFPNLLCICFYFCANLNNARDIFIYLYFHIYNLSSLCKIPDVDL